MIANFADFCLHVYVLVDDLLQDLDLTRGRPGPPPRCSDSELITMVLVGECRGWTVETELVATFRACPELFPNLPERSRFNRRRRNLMGTLNVLRQRLLATLDLAADRQCAIDSLPVPVMGFHLVPASPARATWQAYGASFGQVRSKKQTIFGYKLHLLVTLGGVILDFSLAPANHDDLTAGLDLLHTQQGLVVIGDKAYIGQAAAETLAAQRAVRLLTTPRKNQLIQLDPALARLQNRWRHAVETVTSQLCAQFAIETNHAKTFWGLCTRLVGKLTAHTLCLYLNRQLGVPDWLCIKRLAFPN